MAETINLFPFQAEDVAHLRGQTAVLIANEMGTGKTYEAIARDQEIRSTKAGPTLVIAPLTTLMSTWRQHFEDLTNLSVVVVDPKARKRSWEHFDIIAGDVFCVHWEVLRLMPELFEVQWTHVIADECHRAKNRKAQQTRALKRIDGWYKTAMSGTPVVNRPDELWSILNWLKPKQYGSYWRFFKNYVETTTQFARGHQYQQIVGPKNLDKLHRELDPFFVRRRKKDVLKDLPDKYYTAIKVDLAPEQRRIYNQMRDEMIAWIGQQAEEVLAAPVVIAQLTRLQQFAVAYAQFSEAGRIVLSEPSSKLDACMEVIDEAGEEQIVVFSRFRSLLYLLEERLHSLHISYVSLTGDTPQEGRAKLVDDFQAGKARVFIGTIAAGGIGITLHAASTVIFLDRDWSPALNAQAEDRLHRIGQTNAVQVIDIVARNTIDLGKAQMLETKKGWIRAILGDRDE
jgi:SNF2 family DNA or RNA helicase